MDTDLARHQMVQQQIRTSDVVDTEVLRVMKMLDRAQFVPEQYRDLAYADLQIPLGNEQMMLTPTMEGRLLQALRLKPEHTVLEVGTGSGYLTACLAELAGQVHSIDVFPEFVEQAQYRLQQLQLKNVSIECLDATKALPTGSFDAIAVSSSLPVPLPGLLDLLATGGRMFVVTGETPVMSAQLIQHGADGSWQTDNMFETWLKPMINVAQPPAFSF